MCGIVGFLAKNKEMADGLGRLMAPMLVGMTQRGPDSAGFAVFASGRSTVDWRINLICPVGFDWADVVDAAKRDAGAPDMEITGVARHGLVVSNSRNEALAWIAASFPQLTVMSVGHVMDIYKDVGLPAQVADRYGLSRMAGTHGLGHTRMATESGITLQHAHPFVAGEDFCLVHNGSLSNPFNIRRKLERLGIAFESDNDTEAAARFVQWRLAEGDDLKTALGHVLESIDGFYTLLMGSRDGLAIVRDTFACKPAIVAETDDYVAVASEFRSLKHLPGIGHAEIFEPAPEEVYVWNI